MLSDEELFEAYRGGYHQITGTAAHPNGLRAVEAAVRADTLKDSLPEGGKWFPDEGGIMWKGKVYFPADYVMSRIDIAAMRAETLRDIADEFMARLPDGTGNGRAYNSYTVAEILRKRADFIEGKTNEK
jgi:hypothetical protein